MKLDQSNIIKMTFSNDKKVGVLLTLISCGALAYFLVAGVISGIIIFFIATIIMVYVTLFSPSSLNLLTRFWFQIGELLGKVNNYITLSIIYLVLITPLAILLRMFGRDELRLKQRGATSFWVRRNQTDFRDSFTRQF